MKRERTKLEKVKDKYSDDSTKEKFGLYRRKRDYDPERNVEIIISNSGVYKIGMNEYARVRRSAAGDSDFVPLDFMETRANKDD